MDLSLSKEDTAFQQEVRSWLEETPVSYTHLTLPTIYSV